MNNQNANTNSPHAGNDKSGSANKQDQSRQAPGQQQPSTTKTEQGSPSERKDSPAANDKSHSDK